MRPPILWERLFNWNLSQKYLYLDVFFPRTCFQGHYLLEKVFIKKSGLQSYERGCGIGIFLRAALPIKSKASKEIFSEFLFFSPFFFFCLPKLNAAFWVLPYTEYIFWCPFMKENRKLLLRGGYRKTSAYIDNVLSPKEEAIGKISNIEGTMIWASYMFNHRR